MMMDDDRQARPIRTATGSVKGKLLISGLAALLAVVPAEASSVEVDAREASAVIDIKHYQPLDDQSAFFVRHRRSVGYDGQTDAGLTLLHGYFTDSPLRPYVGLKFLGTGETVPRLGIQPTGRWEGGGGFLSISYDMREGRGPDLEFLGNASRRFWRCAR